MYTCDTLWSFSFSFWLTSLRMMIYNFIHKAANGSFIVSYDWVASYWIYVPHLLYTLICWWTSGCLHVLATLNSAAVYIWVHVSFWISVLSDIGPGVALLNHMATIFFSFLRSLHTVFQQHVTFLSWPISLSKFPLRFNNNLFFLLAEL